MNPDLIRRAAEALPLGWAKMTEDEVAEAIFNDPLIARELHVLHRISEEVRASYLRRGIDDRLINRINELDAAREALTGGQPE